MAKDKRSFFERLTGSISVADDIEELESTAKEALEWEEDSEEGQLPIDVYQTQTEIIIQTMVAGVRPEDLDINITREMVTIKGKRDRPIVAQSDYFQRELYWGSFSRTILLPSEVEAEEAEAIEKNGLVTVRLPKIDKGRTQRLKVKSL